MRQEININRYNYEEYFLLYTDNELNAAEREAVEQFVQKNPDLQQELLLLTQATLKADDDITFSNKELLMQSGSTEHFIHTKNFQELFILYFDDELNNEEKAGVEQFVYDNPEYRQLFELMQSLKVVPDPALTFPDKQMLYRKEKSRKPALSAWWKIASAAVVVLFAGMIWLNNSPSKFSKATVNNGGGFSKKEITPGGSTADKTRNGLNLPDRGLDIDTLPAPLNSIAQAKEEQERKNETPSTGTPKVEKHVAHSNTRTSLPVKEETASRGKVKKTLKPAGMERAVMQSQPEDMAYANSNLNEPGGKYKPVIDQAEITTDIIAKNFYPGKIALASSATDEDENVILANIPVDRKNSLRGFFRKASRLLDKTASIKPAKKSGFTIGNIEIAFQ